jgi:mannose-6-phosphate isomerase-like protein (cupin superfamily)
MKSYVGNIEQAARDNNNFRQVIHTSEHAQVVTMSLLGGEDIGSEVHDLDQLIFVVAGSGVTVLNGAESKIEPGSLIVVPEGAEHNVMNTSEDKMKLYTIYTPPAHRDGTVHVTKAEAEADEDDHY